MVKKGYKQTEIGELPESWETITFEDCFTILPNNTLSRAELNYNGGDVQNIHYGDILVKFHAVLDCSSADLPFINAENTAKASKGFLRDGDLIVADTAEDATVGKSTEVICTGDKTVVSGLHTIPYRPKDGNMFAPGWLGYFVNHSIYHDQIIPYITGIKVSSISKSAISGTLLAVPPKPEQEAIAAALSDIDALIDDMEKLIAKKKAIKQACLQDMFPEPGETVPKMRLPGFSGAWEQRKLGELGSVSMCKRIFKDQTTEEGDVPFYKIGTFGGVADAFISRSLFEDYKAKYPYPPKGAILISASGSIGRTVEFTGNDEYFQDSNIVWLSHDERLDDTFLQHLYEVTKWAGIEGSTIKRLYNDNILRTEIRLPSIAEQQAIGTFFRHLDHLITLHQRKLEKYKRIKQGMMDELLTGRIRLIDKEDA